MKNLCSWLALLALLALPGTSRADPVTLGVPIVYANDPICGCNIVFVNVFGLTWGDAYVIQRRAGPGQWQDMIHFTAQVGPDWETFGWVDADTSALYRVKKEGGVPP